jgi:uncharacterized membrane protein YgcG
MKNMVRTIVLAGIAAVTLPAFGADPARPGTLNYLEGTAYLDSQPLNARNVGSIDVDAGQILSTGQGKAEMLLTPGIYLRLDDNSAVKMISPDLTLTQVELEHGKAGVEVDQIFQENNIEVVEGGVNTRLEKPGYYEFNADKGTVKTFNGEAAVELGDAGVKEVKSHHEFALMAAGNGRPVAKEKPANFDARSGEDDLYNWSNLRSEYLAEANNQMAGGYAEAGSYPGWYWDPWTWDYTFIGGDPFWSPFGWGFYPFGWGGWYGGGYGFYGHPIHRGHGAQLAGDRSGGFRGGQEGGFHGGGGFSSSGFGGGGFHGGGGGGRR